jgi:hypothetical protein
VCSDLPICLILFALLESKQINKIITQYGKERKDKLTFRRRQHNKTSETKIQRKCWHHRQPRCIFIFAADLLGFKMSLLTEKKKEQQSTKQKTQQTDQWPWQKNYLHEYNGDWVHQERERERERKRKRGNKKLRESAHYVWIPLMNNVIGEWWVMRSIDETLRSRGFICDTI